MNFSFQELNIGEIELLCYAIRVSTQIEVLNLSGNGINDNKAYMLAAALQQNCSIRCLILNDNDINNDGALAINDAILNNPNIPPCSFVIDLNNNLLELTYCQPLLMQNNKFSRLDLRNNFIGENSNCGSLHIFNKPQPQKIKLRCLG